MASTVTRSQSNRAPLGCGGTRDSHHGCAADKSAEIVWCYHVNMDQNLCNVSNTLLNLCHEELRQFWRQKGVQPVTSKVYLIKWPVSVYDLSAFYNDYFHYNKAMLIDSLYHCLSVYEATSSHISIDFKHSTDVMKWVWSKNMLLNVILFMCFQRAAFTTQSSSSLKSHANSLYRKRSLRFHYRAIKSSANLCLFMLLSLSVKYNTV